MAKLREDDSDCCCNDLLEKDCCPRGGSVFDAAGILEDCVDGGCSVINGCIGIVV